jgi:hypothetical protein
VEGGGAFQAPRADAVHVMGLNALNTLVSV